MEAAARAASVAPETAKPQSAFFSAGASFTPSPVMPTMWPCFCSTSTMWNLCSGNTWAKPSASSIDLVTAAVSSLLESPRVAPSRMLVPIPRVLAVSLAIASASPVTILILTPHLGRGRDGRFGIVTRRIEQRQHAEKLPFAVSVRAGHAKRPKTAGGEIVDRLVDCGLHLSGIRRHGQDDLRGPLGHLKRLAIRALDRGLGAFVHRIEWLEMRDLIRLERLFVLQAAQNGEVDRVVVLR